MKNIYLLFLLLFTSAIGAQTNFNLELLSNVKFDENGTDIWGYVDESGLEYAVMGTRTATRIFSLEDPSNPKERAVIKGHASVWRDIKSFKTHLYVTTDTGADGLLIVDMSKAPEVITHKFWTPTIQTKKDTAKLNKCHNIYLDTDQGYAYLAGCNIGSGALILDLNQDLDNPVHVGTAEEHYAHDVYVKDDIMYSSEIYKGEISLYDVSDKTNPVYLGGAPTTTKFTHNAWLSDDKKYVFTTDEKPNGAVDAFDVTDPSNVEYLSSFRPQATIGSGVIPHNTHYMGGFLITSWYTDGVIITDATNPKAMVEVGSYDTWLGNHGGFFGCWGAYPYLPSGLLLVSDINSGLYVMQPRKANGTKGYQRASYLSGQVTDINTGLAIHDATISISAERKATGLTDPNGSYLLGYAGEGEYQVIVSHPKYDSDTSLVVLQAGNTATQNFKLGNVDFGFDFKNEEGDVIPLVDVVLRNKNTNSYISLKADESGLVRERLSGSNFYQVYLSKWGYLPKEIELTPDSDKKQTIVLKKGYGDVFTSDLGWRKYGSASTGMWEIETDMKELTYNGQVLQPAGGASSIGNSCYVTEKNTGSLGSNDIDNGLVGLESPAMDFSTKNFARIEYDYFFVYLENDNPADDKMTISISNGTDKHILRVIDQPVTKWTSVSDSFSLQDIPFTDDMKLIVEAGDFGNPHFVEGYFDNFSAEAIVKDLSSSFDQANLEVYVNPNPFSQHLELHGNNEVSIDKIEIFALDGRRLATRSSVNPGENILKNITLEAGTYILRLITARSEVKNIKIIKK